MRTLELHAAFKQVKRSDGRSSVAAAAYRSGTRLVDHRTGEVNNYTRKGGVEHTAIFAPANAPDWARDRSQLWNAAEQKENRSNSMTARELEVSFPAEFSQEQRTEAGTRIATALVERFGVAADICWHEPNTEGDQRNYHAHILFTGRSFDPETQDGWSKKKYRDFNNDRLEVNGEKTTVGKQTVKEFRILVADTYNQITQRDGLEVHTEHESLEKRGIDRIPQIKLGNAASSLERKGVHTDRGDINRRITALNKLKAEIRKAQQELNTFVARSKQVIKAAGEKINPRITPELIKKTYQQYLDAAVKSNDKIKEQLQRDYKTKSELRSAHYKNQPQEPTGAFAGFKKGSYKKQLEQWETKEKELMRSEIAARRKTEETHITLPSPLSAAKEKFQKEQPGLFKEWERIEALEKKVEAEKRAELSRHRRTKRNSQSFER